MKNRKWIVFCGAFFVLAPVAFAQSADDYFHNSANHYIGGDLAEALRVGVLGLQQYSTDQKLNALVEKIKEELEKQQQQQQQQQQQNQQEGEQQDQKDQEQQDQQQEQQDQEKQQEEKQEQQDQQNDEQQQQGQQAEEQQMEEKELPKPDEISKEDAERILNALQKDEQDLQKARKKKGKGRQRTDKDW